MLAKMTYLDSSPAVLRALGQSLGIIPIHKIAPIYNSVKIIPSTLSTPNPPSSLPAETNNRLHLIFLLAVAVVCGARLAICTNPINIMDRTIEFMDRTLKYAHKNGRDQRDEFRSRPAARSGEDDLDATGGEGHRAAITQPAPLVYRPKSIRQ